MHYPDNSARWRLKPSWMSHHVDCYVVTDVEEYNVSNFRANGQLDTKDGGTMALKHPLLFTSWQSIACHCAWMFIRTAVKISNLTKLARFVCSDANWLWVTHSMSLFQPWEVSMLNPLQARELMWFIHAKCVDGTLLVTSRAWACWSCV